MGLVKFVIVIDSPVVYSGTAITGKVLLILKKPKKVRALELIIEGVGNVSWSENVSERVNGETKTTTVWHTGKEEYFRNKFNLIGSGIEFDIPAGEHMYPFTSSLPSTVPSSFKGKHGSVKYIVKAKLDRPWKFNHEATLEFIVVSPLDLNMHQSCKEPVVRETFKSFCCLFCRTGPLNLRISIPYSGYVAGQSIPMSIEVDNASNIEISEVRSRVVQITKWIATDDTKSETETICSLTLESVAKRASKAWSRELTIPSTFQCVNLSGCSIINVTYYLQIEAVSSGCHTNLEIDVPLIVGSVPINQMGFSYSSQAMGENYPNLSPPIGFNPMSPIAFNPSAPVGFTQEVLVNNEPSMYSNCYPPSYEETMASQTLHSPRQVQSVVPTNLLEKLPGLN